MDQLICSEKRTAHQALLLLTDGIVNEGVSKKEDIIEEMRKKQEDVIHVRKHIHNLCTHT